MLSGDLVSEGRRFRDLKAICERAEIVFFDDQGRSNASGFQSNGDMGKTHAWSARVGQAGSREHGDVPARADLPQSRQP